MAITIRKIACPNGDVSNSDDSYTASVASGGSLELPDSQINVNGSNEGNVVSVKTINVNITDGTSPVVPDAVSLSGNTLDIEVPSASTPVGATLMKTGQTTSYRTGDDGDIEAGRDVDFFTLSANNPFGNTNRFTDELGGQTYTNDIVIDWSTYDNIADTVLGYYRDVIGLGTTPWNNAIDNCLAFSVGAFTTGWRLVNRKELFNLVNDGAGNIVLNYSPFNINTNINISSSTTRSDGQPAQIILQTQWGATLVGANKSNAQYYMPCRTFTVNGTTLT